MCYTKALNMPRNVEAILFLNVSGEVSAKHQGSKGKTGWAGSI